MNHLRLLRIAPPKMASRPFLEIPLPLQEKGNAPKMASRPFLEIPLRSPKMHAPIGETNSTQLTSGNSEHQHASTVVSWCAFTTRLLNSHRAVTGADVLCQAPELLRCAIDGLERCTVSGRCDFSLFLRNGVQEPGLGQRVRDVFPLPLLDLHVCHVLLEGSLGDLFGDLRFVMRVANLGLKGLNTMYGYGVVSAGLGLYAPQRAVQLRALQTSSRWCWQMSIQLPPSPDIAWAKLIHDDNGGGPTSARPPLIADRCDLLDRSGRVDPLPFVDDEARNTLSSGATLFGDGDLKHVRAAPIRRDDRCEYARLVARQLRSRKVGFHQNVLCSASIFRLVKPMVRCAKCGMVSTFLLSRPLLHDLRTWQASRPCWISRRHSQGQSEFTSETLDVFSTS